MFWLPGSETVTTGEQLQRALAEGLTRTFPSGLPTAPVAVAGQWPVLDSLAINLTGARLNPDAPPPVSAGAGQTLAELSARRLTVEARPIRWGQEAEVTMELAASEVGLAMIADARQTRWLAVLGATQGTVHAELGEGQLEAMFLDGLRRAAQAHGAAVKSAELSLTQPTPGTLALATEISAQKGFLRGTVLVAGTLQVTHTLSVQFSRLSCEGRGVVGTMAAPVLQPVLRRWEGRSLPLLGHTLGEVRFDHVSIELGARGALRVTAELKP